MSRRKKKKRYGSGSSALQASASAVHNPEPPSLIELNEKTASIQQLTKLAFSIFDEEPEPLAPLKKKKVLSLIDEAPPKPGRILSVNRRPFSSNVWSRELVARCFSEVELAARNQQVSDAVEQAQKYDHRRLILEGPSFTTEPIQVGDFAERLGVKTFEVMKILISLKVFVTKDKFIDLRTMASTLECLGFECKVRDKVLVLAPKGCSLVPATEVPAGLSQCIALEEVSLARNCIFELPRGIEFLPGLKTLNLEAAGITTLQAGFRDCPALSQLFLHHNPALDLPQEILGPTAREVESGRTATVPKVLIDYYEARLAGGRPLNEIKLLLLGRGESGKTSVSRRLRENQFLDGQTETPGIDIRKWIIRCNSNDVLVHMWDFAGQEITHETHRYFLTERSIYLVVLDGRGGQQMEEAEYWLQHVERFGTRGEGEDRERSPVIVVLNKWKSPGPYEVERRRLKREYPNIRVFVEVDCKSGFGFEALHAEIQTLLDQMPAVQQKWPLSYFRVRELLTELAGKKKREERQPFLTWSAFKDVCVRCGVVESEHQESLAESLNSLGMALYYGSDTRLRDTRVLNPNWAANGLYGLLRGVQREPFMGKEGVLWTGNVTAILKEGLIAMDGDRGATIDDYPERSHGVNVHEFLVELMQDREMGFLAGEHNGRPLFFLPSLLPVDEPAADQFNIADHIDSAELRFRFLYELLPAGIMSRFIVRTHFLSDATFRWQRGVVLEWERASALLIAERRRNPRIDVYIQGGDEIQRQQLAGIVRMNLREIEHTLPDGFRSREELDLTIPGDQYESVEKLIRLESQNEPVQVVTDEGALQIQVTPELEQLQPVSARLNAANLKLFVSYAHENFQSLGRLRTHLDVLLNEHLVQWWYDGKVRPGSVWDNRIRIELADADVVVFLISNAFFASKYISGVEIAETRRRSDAQEVRVLPVLLEETPPFERHEWLSTLQAVPVQDGLLRPLNNFRPQVNGWNLVQRAIRDIAAEFEFTAEDSTPLANEGRERASV
jgi:internalin A